MFSKIAKFSLMVVITLFLTLVVFKTSAYIGSLAVSTSLDSVRNNMGDQIQNRFDVTSINLINFIFVVLSFFMIGGLWMLVYKKQIIAIIASGFLGIFLIGCTTSNFVIIPPPNYGIVINTASPSDQATGNNFASGELMNVTQVRVNLVKCAADSPDMCPDKLIAEVEGSPVSRIYSKDSNSGTSTNNQALCFEATGANGCVDFSITAIILKEDARCYANKMGVKPAAGSGQERFHFIATPLHEALDTRVIQVASAEFAKAVAPMSPLELALKKFDVFKELKPQITKIVHDQTCVTVTDLSINNGIEWGNQIIQDQINQATVIANQADLMAKQNAIYAAQNQAFISRTLEIEKAFGTQAAVELMKIQKWDGSSMLPFLQQPAPDVKSSKVISK